MVQNLIGQRLLYRNPENPELERAVRNVVFITIVIHSSPCTAYEAGATCEGQAGPDTSWNEAMSPIRALLNTRDRRADVSSRDLTALTALIEQFSTQMPDADTSGAGAEGGGQFGCREIICAVTLRFHNAPGVEVPLSWLLSDQARAAMDQAVDGVQAANVRAGAPERVPDVNVNWIEGSYRRILCILDARKDTPGCTTPAPAAGGAPAQAVNRR
jgi:hypothetical protein